MLVLPDGGRFPLQDPMTIGRGDDVTLKIDDRTVSRVAARIAGGPDGPMIEDAGSRFGITVSGQPLSAPRRLLAGQEIQLGSVVLRVESAVGASAPVAGQVGLSDPVGGGCESERDDGGSGRRDRDGVAPGGGGVA